jgi:hypothetical protein
MNNMICINCGFVGNPTKRAKGSFVVELVLWSCFVVPGLIYSLWRLTTKETVCRRCGAENMLPVNSPHGRKLTQRLGLGLEQN